MQTIVTTNDGQLVAKYDPNDAELPIGVVAGRLTGDEASTDYAWMEPDEARRLASAILAKVGGGAASAAPASEMSFNEGLLRLAAVHGKTVTFRYAKGSGGIIEQRVLKPSKVQEVDGHLSFTGFDPDRDDVRSYRVDRMKGEVSVA